MVKIAIIGAGFMGKMHGNVYANLPESKVVAVVDTIPAKAEEVAKPHGAKIATRLDEVLDSVEMVDVCLPTFLHAKYTVMAAQAQKHVLCEKPIALNLKDADRMVTTAKKAGVKFMVAHCIRFWPEYMALKEMFDKKLYGRLISIWMSRVSPLPTWSSNNWLLQGSKSGGAITDLHIHDADFLLYLLGKPESVFCRGTKNKHGWVHVWTAYNYKRTAAVAEGGWDLPAKFPFNMAFRAIFEKGIVEFGLQPQPRMLLYQGDSEPVPVDIPQPKVSNVQAGGNISSLGGYFNEIQYLLECISEDKEPAVVTPQDARTSLQIILAEQKSAETGKMTKI
jgi:predicted dehydrogenase